MRRMSKFEVLAEASGYAWQLKASNGRIMARSADRYPTADLAVQAVTTMLRVAGEARLEIPESESNSGARGRSNRSGSLTESRVRGRDVKQPKPVKKAATSPKRRRGGTGFAELVQRDASIATSGSGAAVPRKATVAAARPAGKAAAKAAASKQAGSPKTRATSSRTTSAAPLGGQSKKKTAATSASRTAKKSPTKKATPAKRSQPTKKASR